MPRWFRALTGRVIGTVQKRCHQCGRDLPYLRTDRRCRVRYGRDRRRCTGRVRYCGSGQRFPPRPIIATGPTASTAKTLDELATAAEKV